MIIGRKYEQLQLERLHKSKTAEFLVVYGRRRIGKTFLINQFFENKNAVFFQSTGLQKGNRKKQLAKFSDSFSQTFLKGIDINPPKDWGQAFKLLHAQIKETAKSKKIVIFLDELPWMATKKSGLLEELDYYWNQYWSKCPNVILIVCGSSASWLIQKIIYNQGGLHNRITFQMRLSPFNIEETKKFLCHIGFQPNNAQILDLYLALGGVPYYLKYINPLESSTQNIQKLFFSKEAPLKDEFKKLFNSLFEEADKYIEIIRCIAQKRNGLLRSELKEKLQLSGDGGRLSKRLTDLSEAGFIMENIPYGKQKGELLRVIDEFCLFYLHWVEGYHRKNRLENFWFHQSQKPSYYAWSGLAFEALCHKNIEKIVRLLNIQAHSTSSWIFIPKKAEANTGAQIDLLIEHTDGSITLCEIKHSQQPYVFDKTLAHELKRKEAVFRRNMKFAGSVFWALITSSGIKPSVYSEDMLSAVVTLENLIQ